MDPFGNLPGQCYGVSVQFIGQTVEARFLPDDTGSAYVLYGGQHYPMRLTDWKFDEYDNENLSKK